MTCSDCLESDALKKIINVDFFLLQKTESVEVTAWCRKWSLMLWRNLSWNIERNVKIVSRSFALSINQNSNKKKKFDPFSTSKTLLSLKNCRLRVFRKEILCSYRDGELGHRCGPLWDFFFSKFGPLRFRYKVRKC